MINIWHKYMIDPSWHSTGGFMIDHNGDPYCETVYMIRDSKTLRVYGRFKGPAIWWERKDAERFCKNILRFSKDAEVIEVSLKEIVTHKPATAS